MLSVRAHCLADRTWSLLRLVPVALLVVAATNGLGQEKPTGACPFRGYQSDPYKEPVMAAVATKAPAVTWMNCEFVKGCVPLKASPGAPVEVYRTEGEWTCGYTMDRKGAGPAWFRFRDLRPIAVVKNPPVAAWYGTWVGGEDHVEITAARDPKAVHLVGNAVWQGGHGNEHFGDTQGNAVPQGNRLHYVDGGCTIDLTLAGKFMVAEDNEGCGGLNARFGGLWRRAASSRAGRAAK